jgi:hypothetical protein
MLSSAIASTLVYLLGQLQSNSLVDLKARKSGVQHDDDFSFDVVAHVLRS